MDGFAHRGSGAERACHFLFASKKQRKNYDIRATAGNPKANPKGIPKARVGGSTKGTAGGAHALHQER